VNSPPVTSAVISRLALPLTPQQLAAKISATAPLDTVLINVTVKDGTPERAQAMANATAAQFTQFVSSLEQTDPTAAPPVKVSVVKPAELPVGPVSPRVPLNLALGLLFGLAVGVGAAVLRETLDTSIKSGADLSEHFGLTTLGVIGFDANTPRRPLLVHEEPQSPRAETFRQLRTNLQFIDVDSAPRSIVVTSSVPGEGKTTTTVNLAISLAQAGQRVIVVEGDLRRPQLASFLGLEGAVGLTSVLIGRAELDEALQPWGEEGLQVLASGPTPPNPSELLGSHGMQELLRTLEARADLVLLDSPPLLPVTDAAVLSTVASGAVLVIRVDRTRREQVDHALESLQAVGARVLGAVLNMAPTRGPNAYRYGYQYDYRPQNATSGPGENSRPKLDVNEVPLTPAHQDGHDGSGPEPRSGSPVQAATLRSAPTATMPGDGRMAQPQ
jgi:capsular exopolysaccharide synthesis family protein